MTEVCGILSNEDLQSSSDKQPRMMAIACIVFEVSGKQLKKRYHTHGLGEVLCLLSLLCFALLFCQLVALGRSSVSQVG